MHCPHCKKDSPIGRTCIHCGGKLKLTRKQVLKLVRMEAMREQEAYTTRQVRRWLTFAGALFVLALCAFILTRGTATARIIPMYPYANPTTESHIDLPVDGVVAPSGDEAESGDDDVQNEPRVFVEMHPEELVPRFPRFVRTDAEMAESTDD